ncbi:MAG: 50S ribosomal protein L23 [Planctomycetes bacterium]|nr:50S ribosomal protein L23 [Planctomycetota bacterium]
MKSPYDIVIKPLVTEKSTNLASPEKQRKELTYTFMVDRQAGKPAIKQAVEVIFPVKVAAVRTVNMSGKPKTNKVIRSHRSNWKKAYVTLKEGFRLEVI